MRTTFIALALSAWCTAAIGTAPAATAARGTISVTVRSAISLTVVGAAREPVFAVVTNCMTGYALSVSTEVDVVTITAGIR